MKQLLLEYTRGYVQTKIKKWDVVLCKQYIEFLKPEKLVYEHCELRYGIVIKEPDENGNFEVLVMTHEKPDDMTYVVKINYGIEDGYVLCDTIKDCNIHFTFPKAYRDDNDKLHFVLDANGKFAKINKLTVTQDVIQLNRDTKLEIKNMYRKYYDNVTQTKVLTDDLDVSEQKKVEEIDDLIEDIYNLRKEGISKEGEYSILNLVFKQMRDMGYLDNLKTLKRQLKSKELSLEGLNEALLVHNRHNYRKLFNLLFTSNAKDGTYTLGLITGDLNPESNADFIKLKEENEEVAQVYDEARLWLDNQPGVNVIGRYTDERTKKQFQEVSKNLTHATADDIVKKGLELGQNSVGVIKFKKEGEYISISGFMTERPDFINKRYNSRTILDEEHGILFGLKAKQSNYYSKIGNFCYSIKFKKEKRRRVKF